MSMKIILIYCMVFIIVIFSTNAQLTCSPTCNPCTDYPCTRSSGDKITITSDEGPTWSLDFGIGAGNMDPLRMGAGVAYNLRIPYNSETIDGVGGTCCGGKGLDNHEWRWRWPTVPPDCSDVVGAGTRADMAVKSISAEFTLVEESSDRIEFIVEGTSWTEMRREVFECDDLTFEDNDEYSDFTKTVIVTPDGYSVDLDVTYRGTDSTDGMWWTVMQFKNAEESDEFSQGILPSKVEVTDGSKTLPLRYSPHSNRYLGWDCGFIGEKDCSNFPNGRIYVPYTMIFPLKSPIDHKIEFSVNDYEGTSGNDFNYEFWHEEGYDSPPDIGKYSVIYPRWSGALNRGTTYHFEWAWDFTRDWSGDPPVDPPPIDPPAEEPTCNDGIMNGEEQGIDCGGSCSACPEIDGNILWIEGESPDTTNALFETVSDTGASEGEYIWIAEGVGNDWTGNSNDFITYNVNIASSGDYHIWGRVISPDGNSNSFIVQIDDGTNHVWSMGESTEWIWNKADNDDTGGNVFSLTAGDKVLRLRHREDGTKLDKILITDDLAYTPTGLGGGAGNDVVDINDVNQMVARWLAHERGVSISDVVVVVKQWRGGN